MNNKPENENDMLRDRLFAELKASTTGSDEFADAFKYVQMMDKKEEKDPELIELEKDALRSKIRREDAETQKLSEEPQSQNFFTRHADVLIPASATLVGVVVIVAAEVFGPAILNSKALNRLPKP